MKVRRYKVLCFFGGSGGGARGFIKAKPRLFDTEVAFDCVGSVDFDANACDDFRRFTGSKALCADINDVTPVQLRELAGDESPDAVFMSPPCKGASRLITSEKAASPKYVAMNQLALVALRLMLATWERPPALVLLENVPGLPTRAAKMVRELKQLLRSRGYVVTDGFHCCGEIGGLAQRRKRYLLVARQPERCAPILRKPPKRRVRGVGEVLGPLPMPATAEAEAWGKLHTMPRLSWRNWLRLAMIPAGGDWRDLEGVLAQEQQRRDVFGRHGVLAWSAPTGAVAGTGSNGVGAVSDPRLADLAVVRAYDAGYAVLAPDQPARTIASESAVGCGAYAVADARTPRPDALPARRLTLDEALALDLPGDRPPPFVPVIEARDGTWHRPLTLLELGVLQSYPITIEGEPIHFAGTRTEIAEHIGNSVPEDAAQAIGEVFGTALLQHELEQYSLGMGDVWVGPVSDRSDS